MDRFPQFDREAPKPVFFALATPDETKLKNVPFAAHPSLLRIYCAKHALNLARLAMMEAL